MPTRRAFVTVGTLSLAAGALGVAPAARAAKGKPKYYFRVHEIDVEKAGDPALKASARGLLEKELAKRPEFTNELEGAQDDAAVLAELKQRGLQGFRVSLRLDGLSKELKPPKPGGRLKQLSVTVTLSVFGTTFPGEKLAFGGEGQTTVEAEVVEQRLATETPPLVESAMEQALIQAVDQAVLKLALPKAAPMNESKRNRRARGASKGNAGKENAPAKPKT